jgi:hypothetical protein
VGREIIEIGKVGREQWEGRRREGKHTISAVEGILVNQTPLTASDRECG